MTLLSWNPIAPWPITILFNEFSKSTSACFPIITFFSPLTNVWALKAPIAVLYLPFEFNKDLKPTAVLLWDNSLLFKQNEPMLLYFSSFWNKT